MVSKSSWNFLFVKHQIDSRFFNYKYSGTSEQTGQNGLICKPKFLNSELFSQHCVCLSVRKSPYKVKAMEHGVRAEFP